MIKRIVILVTVIGFLSCKNEEAKVAMNNTTASTTEQETTYKVSKTNEEWKQILSPQEYNVLREAGTERPFTSPLNKQYKPGTLICAACYAPVYNNEHKFDSGTGWPSYDRAIDGQVERDTDYKIGYARTELKCATCGSHLGHEFNDGPRRTTGKRHCINGVALNFIPEGESLPELRK
ncbi:peptide-methionine (R)-S-oxide reductase MsrB [Nonlabens tegetincola]|uniref:peptide-methionine (R)-S-oxide reductase MsrB n=1 Tax=Nonlabens tegetincola TaxID=323273 RepID=UPI0038B2615F